MDSDSEAREVFDRMAIDFAQMVKRSDVYYLSARHRDQTRAGGTMAGNDQIAFYSTVPGYYPHACSAARFRKAQSRLLPTE